MWEILVILLSDGLDPGLIVAMTGVLVAGLAAVLGIWMERDQAKPPRYAYALSALILLATVVSVMQSYLDSKAGEKMEEDMARMLQRMDEIAANSDDPALQELIGAELAAQSRSNPDVVKKLAQRVSDEGGDPTEMLGRHMDASEVENVSRKGLMKVKKPKKAAAGKGKGKKGGKGKGKKGGKGKGKKGGKGKGKKGGKGKGKKGGKGKGKKGGKGKGKKGGKGNKGPVAADADDVAADGADADGAVAQGGPGPKGGKGKGKKGGKGKGKKGGKGKGQGKKGGKGKGPAGKARVPAAQ